MNMTTATLLATARAMPDGPAKRSLLGQLTRPTSVAPMAAPAASRPAQQPRHVTGRMNKTEAAYAARLEAMKAGGGVLWWKFEPVKLRLAQPGDTGSRGVWYTVDFLVADADAGLCWDEVKGGWITEDGLLKWRWAAEQFPGLRLRMWQRQRGHDWVCVRQSDAAQLRTI